MKIVIRICVKQKDTTTDGTFYFFFSSFINLVKV